MEIEFTRDNHEATGKKLYLQLKSGDSYLRECKGERYCSPCRGEGNAVQTSSGSSISRGAATRGVPSLASGYSKILPS